MTAAVASRHLPHHPADRIAYCLHQARANRHHPDCRCGRHEGYCTAADQLWSRAADRELETWHRM